MKRSGVSKTIIISLAIIVAAGILGFFYRDTKKPLQTISVIGLAEKDFEADLIVWNSDYSSKSQNLKDAYTELQKQTQIVKEYLAEKGISDTEIVFRAINNEEDYDSYYDNGKRIRKFNGYILSQSVKVTSTDVNKIEKIANDITELIYQGINFNSYPPQYYYTKLADLKIAMLADATKDAKLRAETIAQNAGSKLKGLKSSNMGTFQITAPNSSEDQYSWGGAFNTSSKFKRAAITLRVVYKTF